MPRPGPRPYECVKRAWHSDRHQPIRGSLIREIFRIANEIHGPATRKNKEWQEKLPSVVFKAEEILYSKAGSEDEYVEVSTLWERVNDAVDTIIRRDDVNESGDLLLPCIEAALTVGCIPRRASRSQRHSNPRYYLNSSGPEECKDGSSSVPCSTQRSAIDGGKAPYSLPMAPSWFNRLPKDQAFFPLSGVHRLPGFRATCCKPDRTTDRENAGRVYPLCYLETCSSSFPRESDSSGDGKNFGKESRSEGLHDGVGECDLSLQLSLPVSCCSRKRSFMNEDESACFRESEDRSRLKQRCLSGGLFYGHSIDGSGRR